MKTIYRVQSFMLTAKTNFNKCETVKGCYRDKWSCNESLRIEYYLVKMSDNIRFIKFINNKHYYLQRRGDIFIVKSGNIPQSSNKSNTITKKIIA